MTQKELAQRLAATGLPVAYRAFRTRQAPPFICYLYVYDRLLSCQSSNSCGNTS